MIRLSKNFILAALCCMPLHGATVPNAVTKYADTIGTITGSSVKIDTLGNMTGLYNLSIANDINAVNNIYMSGGNITGVNDIQMSGDLYGANDLRFTGDIVADGDLYMEGDIFGAVNIHMNGGNLTGVNDVDMTGDVNGANNINLSGNGDINNVNNLNMTGAGDIIGAKDVYIDNNLSVGNNTHITGNLVVEGTITGTLADGDVVFGSGASTENALPRYSNFSGNRIKDSSVIVTDDGDMYGVNNLEVSNNLNVAHDTYIGNELVVSGTLFLNEIATPGGEGVIWPTNAGSTGQFLGIIAPGVLGYASPEGSGNVSTSTAFTSDNKIVVTAYTEGAQNIKESSVNIDASNNISGVLALSASSVNASSAISAPTVSAQTVNATTGAATINAGTLNATTINATTVTAPTLNGTASGNLPFTGGTLTGNLNLATQSALSLQDASGGEAINVRAPATVASNYTIELPGSAPLAGQYLQALAPLGSIYTTTWTNIGGTPAFAKTYYVSVDGSDTPPNNGSFSAPFKTIKKAVLTAKDDFPDPFTNPIAISVGAGIFQEERIDIDVNGLTIVGSAQASTIIEPKNPTAEDLFYITKPYVELTSLTIQGPFVPPYSTFSALNINTTTYGRGVFSALGISGFATAIRISTTGTAPTFFFERIQLAGNTTGLDITNALAIVTNSVIRGPLGGGTPLNTGVTITGSSSSLYVSNSLLLLLNKALSIDGGATARVISSSLESTNTTIECKGGSKSQLIGLNFLYNNATATNVLANNAKVYLEGCLFDCESTGDAPAGTAIKALNNAEVVANACTIEEAEIGIICGQTGVTLDASTVQATNCTLIETLTSLHQQENGSIFYVGGSLEVHTIIKEKPEKLSLSLFNTDDDATLALGNTANESKKIYEVLNSTTNLPYLSYEPSFYGYRGTIYQDPSGAPIFNGTLASNNSAYYGVITTDTGKQTALLLASDRNPLHNGNLLRGWGIIKKGNETADLSFTYTDSDPDPAITNRGPYEVMRLNGRDNLVQFPVATGNNLPSNLTAKLEWGGDTSLYRQGIGALQTDGLFSANTFQANNLTPNRILVSDGNKQLSSSSTTTSELEYLSSVTAPIQGQLDSKVAKTGDTMTGSLTLPAGTTALPSLNFTGGITAGLSSNSGDVSFSTAATERMKINAAGAISINSFSTTPGVVHSNASKELSSSLIVNDDITDLTITDSKLTSISTPGKVQNSATTATSLNTSNALVARDASGNFAANVVTAMLTGTASGNLPLTGGTLSGNLNLAAQKELRLQDLAGGEYIGFKAPEIVPTSYTLNLPANKPAAGQFLQALTDELLTWTTLGGSPEATKTYYVSLSGSDSNDGSFANPFRSVKHAVAIANTEAATYHPIAVKIGAGKFYEDNSDGAFLISNDEVSILGSSVASTVLYATSTAHNFFEVTTPNVEFSNLMLIGPGGTDKSAIYYNSNNFGRNRFSSVGIGLFPVGLNLNTGVPGSTIVFIDNLQCSGNGTALKVNNVQVALRNSLLQGSISSPVNTGILVQGSGGQIVTLSTYFSFFNTAIRIEDGCQRLVGCNIETTKNGILCLGGTTRIVGCDFLLPYEDTIHISASGAPECPNLPQVTIVGSHLQCTNASCLPCGVGVKVTNEALALIDSCDIQQSVTAIICGQSGDLANTMIKANGVNLVGCQTDIVQNGLATVHFIGGSYEPTKLLIDDHTNITFASFNSTSGNLSFGNASDTPATLYCIENGQNPPPILTYESDYYHGYKGTVYKNQANNPTFNAVQAQSNDVCFCAITNDKTKTSGIHLISDTSQIGNPNNVRGWELLKTGTDAYLDFSYMNNDDGQVVRTLYPVMRLNGVDNRIEFPVTDQTITNTTAHLVWGGDAELYRSADSTLTVGNNLAISGLNTPGVVHTNAQGLLSTSLIVDTDITNGTITDAKLATITTAGKVANTATTATNANNPSTIVLRDANRDFSARNITLRDGAAKAVLDGNVLGDVTGNLFGNAANATSANTFSTGLSGDVTGGANGSAVTVQTVGNVSASNLASTYTTVQQATADNIASRLVRRGPSGEFSAGTITATQFVGPLSGTVTRAVLADHALRSDYAWSFTGQLAGNVTGSQDATVVATVGGQSAADVAAATILANTATWANTFDTLVRRNPIDGSFASGPITANLLGNAATATNATYFTTPLSGDLSGGDLGTTTTILKVGGKSASAIATSVDATEAAINTNTPSTIVKRDASGNFSAGMITANLTGNVTGNASTATSATSATSATNFTGNLSGDVTGNQGSTVVVQVGGKASTNIASSVNATENASSSATTGDALVKRNGSGGFSAGAITATSFSGPLTGNATTATLATHALRSDYAWSFTGQLEGNVTGPQSNTVVAAVGGKTASTIASATDLTLSATSDNTFDTIVRRDAIGNFSASTIYANLQGTAASATEATYFTTPLSGDLIGGDYGKTTTVLFVGGKSANLIATSVDATNAATNTNTASTIVKRDPSGNFSAGMITANLTGNVTGNASTATSATSANSAINFTGPLTGDVTGNQGSTVVSSVGGKTNTAIATSVNATENASSSATTGDTLVKRNGSGGFSAGAITATSFSGPLTGNVTGNVTGNLFGIADYATYATTSTNFTGALDGDVKGYQGTTSVYQVGGVLAASIASGANLANAATALDTANTIVKRDASGNFATNMITIEGTVSNPTDVTTKQYVDDAVTGGIVPKTPVLVTSISDTALTGTGAGHAPIDGVTLSDNDRVLLTAQTNQLENGIWLSLASTWTRPSDFAEGTQAQGAYVLTNSGESRAGTGWLCSTPLAIVGTDTVTFVQFSSSGQTTAANLGNGSGKIFKDKTGITLNLRSLAQSDFINIANGTNEITFSLTATSDNTPDNLVARDALGNFKANTIEASLSGSASLNVLKSGDTMAGNLVMADSQLRLANASTNYVGLKAPATLTNYVVSLPAQAPTASQYLQALTDSSLTWTTLGLSPATSYNIYVAKGGNDSNDGSIIAPFATIKKAIDYVDTTYPAYTPVTINVGAGVFIEDNSDGPLTFAATSYISLVGSAIGTTWISPQDYTKNLFKIDTSTAQIANLSIDAAYDTSTASAIVLSTDFPGYTVINTIAVTNFQTGISLQSTTTNPTVIIENVQFGGNTTSILINNIRTLIKGSLFQGPYLGDQAINTAINATQSLADVAIMDSYFTRLATAVTVSNGAHIRVVGGSIEETTQGISCSSGDAQLIGINFIHNPPTAINVEATGSNSSMLVEGCLFNCADSSNVRQGIGVQATNGAQLIINASTIEKALVGIKISDASTQIQANGVTIVSTTTCIEQQDTSTLKFVGGSFEIEKTDIKDATNVSFAAFNSNGSSYLALGNGTDTQPSTLYQVLNGKTELPSLVYQPNYYGHKGIVFNNPNPSPAMGGLVSISNDAYQAVITGDRTKTTRLGLLSNEGTIGIDSNMKGWSITKLGNTNADLVFTYTNNDGAAYGPNNILELDGVANEVRFPTATNAPGTTPKLVWGGDTNLYRSAANTLKTDDSFVVANNLTISSLGTTTGLVHVDNTGLLSSSLLVNADIASNAAIADTKLATISTAGKVANSATTATPNNTANAIVARDASGNFNANLISASITGTALANVLKVGDTMTGNLVMANSELRLANAATNYVGLKAPATLNNYSVALPSQAPAAGQFLQALTDSTLTWTTIGLVPTANRIFYVEKGGDDTNNGSILAPYATLKKALQEANNLSTYAEGVVIKIGPGNFIEDNTDGALTITGESIAIVGSAVENTYIYPLSPTNNLLYSDKAALEISNLTLAGNNSSGTALTIATDTPGFTLIKEIAIRSFNTGINLQSPSSSSLPVVIIQDAEMADNGTCIAINNIKAIVQNSLLQGPLVTVFPPTGTAITISGSNADVGLFGDFIRSFSTGVSISNASRVRCVSGNIENTINGFVCTSGETQLVGTNFIVNKEGYVNVTSSNSGTRVIIEGCLFDCADDTDTPQGTALVVTNGAQLTVNASTIEEASIGIAASGNTSTIQASGLNILDTTTCIQQQDLSTLKFVGGSFEIAKTDIQDATNVSFAAFNSNGSSYLALGNGGDTQPSTLYQVLNGQTELPSLVYQPNYYGHKGIVFNNPNPSPAIGGLVSISNDAYQAVITGDRTKTTRLGLLSNEGTIGIDSNIKGWSITKLGNSNADLVFTYSNNDGAAYGPNNIMELDGVANEVRFPTAPNAPGTTPTLVWGGDTNLYRSAANTLKTDDSFVVANNLTVSSLGTTTGLVHVDNTGLLSSSLLVNADIASNAAIADTKLATISTAGKVANSATTATDANTANAIVARDASGNFNANLISASITGTALANVLKTGDTMTGNLILSDKELRLANAATNYVGLKAPASLNNYTVTLPSQAPSAGQFLQALDASILTWTTVDAPPTATKTYYVALNGNDSNDGSLSAPLRTVKEAVSRANTVATPINPVTIEVGAGVFVEDIATGSITITAPGISITGSTMANTILISNSLSNDFFTVNTPDVSFSNLIMRTYTTGSTAAAIVITSEAFGRTRIDSVGMSRFARGMEVNSSSGLPYIFIQNFQCTDLEESLYFKDVQVTIRTSLMQGSSNETPLNTGMIITGTSCQLSLFDTHFMDYDTALLIRNQANQRVIGCNIESTNNGIVCLGGSSSEIIGSNFIFNNATSVNITVSEAGTVAAVVGCHIHGADRSNIPYGTGVIVARGAQAYLDSTSMVELATALQCGEPGDTIATKMDANAITIVNTTTDIKQQGSSTLNFVGGSFQLNKTSINDATNVNFAAFSSNGNQLLALGKNQDVHTTLYQIATGQNEAPYLAYDENYYGYKGTAYVNSNDNPTFNATQSNLNDARYYVATGNNEKEAGISLISDTNQPGISDNIRGWSITKTSTNAHLALSFVNNDPGIAIRDQYNVMRLDGINNRVEFPTATGTQIPPQLTAELVWGDDTNLYRSAENTLKTDDNLVIGGLAGTAGVVHSDATGLLSNSLITNADIIANAGIVDTKLETISTPGKVSNNATTATNLNTANAIVARDSSGNFVAGTITANLNGNANTATSATSATTAGSATNFTGSLNGDVTGTQGVTVVSLVGGQLASAVASATQRANSATSANTPDTLVLRAPTTGNFSAGTITATLNGNATSATTAVTSTTATYFTGSLSGDVIGNQAATIVALIGGKTAAAVAASTTTVEAATSANTANALVLRDASGNFSAGSITADLLGQATSAITSTTSIYFTGQLAGNVTGTQGATIVSAVGNKTAAEITSAVTEVQLSSTAPAANTLVKRDNLGDIYASTFHGTFEGSISNAVTALTSTTALYFTGPLSGDVIGTQGATVVSTVGLQSAANVAAATVLANAATSSNTASAIVRRDASGNFSAGTITASLSGNATTATTATNFSGSLTGDVTGGQTSTVVATVGGVSAVNVASGANLANAATSNNTASTIVRRDASGNFSAGTITASLTGAASLNVLKAGDTMTGTLTLPAGTTATPSLQFSGSTNTGLSAPSANTLSLSTNGIERMSIDSTGTVSIPGTLVLAGGTVRSPSFKFANGSNTGISSPSANTLSFDINGIERMNIDSTDVTVSATLVAGAPLLLNNALCDQAIQIETGTGTAGTPLQANANTSIMFLNRTTAATVYVRFPDNPTDGQLFTIMTQSINTVTISQSAGTGGASFGAGAITSLDADAAFGATTAGASVTYIYIAATNTWYRFFRG